MGRWVYSVGVSWGERDGDEASYRSNHSASLLMLQSGCNACVITDHGLPRLRNLADTFNTGRFSSDWRSVAFARLFVRSISALGNFVNTMTKV
jgi:hypothetical protein